MKTVLIMLVVVLSVGLLNAQKMEETKNSGNVVILLAHSSFKESQANKALIDAVKNIPGVVIMDLYAKSFDAEAYKKILSEAKAVVFQFPFYWASAPSQLKKWLDEIFTPLAGTEVVKGKPLMVATTTGSEYEAYRSGGRNHFTMDELLRPYQLVANYPELLARVGGYVSYQVDDGKINTVFYGKNNPNSIMIRYQFTDLLNHTFTTLPLIGGKDRNRERKFIATREAAFKMLRENADSFFTFYENTSVNCILVPVGRKKKVYILTAPKSYGNVLLGGDYMLTYNSSNLLVDRRKIHNSLITLSAGNNVSKDTTAMTMHSHVLSEAIDPTDICKIGRAHV